jgi:phospholipid/cholesterol/gamma-HCH transport system substrate-binding protein
LANNLAALTTSLKDTGGVERLMDYIFYQVAAINGYDSVGHYLRAGLLLNQCSSYSTTGSPACSAKFGSNEATEASARAESAKVHAPAAVGGAARGPAAAAPAAAGAQPTASPAPADRGAQDALLGYLLGSGG